VLKTVASVSGPAVLALLVIAGTAWSATKDLGRGYQDHGAASRVSSHRGIIATVDGEGRNVVLVWLMDHRGGYELLLIDAETGRHQEVPVPFRPKLDSPYASLLSSRNKLYTHFGHHFVEFDPVKRSFTFCARTAYKTAMGMTEDDEGLIWSVTYPNSGVVSFDPATRELKDHGAVYKQDWAQYQRHVAADDKGWIYFGVGHGASQIVAFKPGTAQATLMVTHPRKGHGYVYRDLDGKVYGHIYGIKDDWYELYQGKKTRIGEHRKVREKPIITSSQRLFHRDFPDGKKLLSVDTVERVLVVEDPATNEKRRVTFDYHSEGAHVMGLAAAPDGTICGGTSFPVRFFSYDPGADQWTDRTCSGQWNALARQGDRFFAGAYGGGVLMEWNPSQKWAPAAVGKKGGNPRLLTRCTPTINRPHDLLAHPDGRTLVMAGSPGYGRVGGGMLFWDREAENGVLLEHEALIPQHTTISLLALPGRKLLGGTSHAKGAELYVMDMGTKKIEWHAVVFPGMTMIYDLCPGPDGLVYGIADKKLFFVFDPIRRKVVYKQDTVDEFGGVRWQQGPRAFVLGPDRTVYLLCAEGIAKVDRATSRVAMLAESPVTITAGGDLLNGRIYFAGASRVYSYGLPSREE